MTMMFETSEEALEHLTALRQDSSDALAEVKDAVEEASSGLGTQIEEVQGRLAALEQDLSPSKVAHRLRGLRPEGFRFFRESADLLGIKGDPDIAEAEERLYDFAMTSISVHARDRNLAEIEALQTMTFLGLPGAALSKQMLLDYVECVLRSTSDDLSPLALDRS